MPHTEPGVPKPEQISFFERQVMEAQKELDALSEAVSRLEAQTKRVNKLLVSSPSREDIAEAGTSLRQAGLYAKELNPLLARFEDAFGRIDAKLASGSAHDLSMLQALQDTQTALTPRITAQMDAFEVAAALYERTVSVMRNN